MAPGLVVSTDAAPSLSALVESLLAGEAPAVALVVGVEYCQQGLRVFVQNIM